MITDHNAPAAVAAWTEMLIAAGWQVRIDSSEARLRVAAEDPTGAAVMITSRRPAAGKRGRTRIYVLHRRGARLDFWMQIRSASLEHFVTARELRAGAYAVKAPTLCNCGKSRLPTEARAWEVLPEVQARRAARNDGRPAERRVYLCPDDDRVWHLTSKPERNNL